MKQTLTDRLLRSLQRPKDKPVAITDCEVRTLRVRASRTGVVSFSVLKRPPGSRQLAHYPVGTYPLVSLVEARRRAREILREIEDGVDPRARKAEEARRAAAEKACTFAAVAEEFIAKYVAAKRTGREIESRIRRELISRWGDRPIARISHDDVVGLIDDIVARGHPEAARQTLTYTRRLFRWAAIRYKQQLPHIPTTDLEAKELIGEKKIRKRVLNDAELALFWRATEGPEAAVYGPFFRLLLFVGVRRSELGRAPATEFDLDRALWTIPAQRAKMDDAIEVQLAAPALVILRTLQQENRLSAKFYMLGRTVHYVRAKDWLDARMCELNGGKPIPHWTLHDLRRTCRTGLARLKIQPHIAELCIGHGKKGLHKVYDQHQYADEKRHAFDAWAAHVMRVVEPAEEKVVALRPAR
jgi:integrase